MQTRKEMTPHCTEAEAQDNHIWRSRHQHQIQAGQELGDKFERTLRSNDNDELPTRSSSCVYEYENRLLVWYTFLIIIVTPTTTKRHNDTRIVILLFQSEEDGFRFSRDEGRSRTGGRTLWRCFEEEQFQNVQSSLSIKCNRASFTQRSAGHDLPYHRLYHTTFSSSSTRVAGINDVAQNTQS